MNKHLHRLGLLLICGFPALLVSVSATFLTQRPLPKPPAFAEASSRASDCINKAGQGTVPLSPDTFYPDDGVSIIPQEGGWRFMGRAWLAAQLCGAGTLFIQGVGQEAGNELPRLEISLNGKPLTSEAFSAQERSVEIQVPHAGRLTIAYLNDYYLSEARAITIDRIQLLGTNCNAVWAKRGIQRDAGILPISLISQTVTLDLCGDGILELRAWGRAWGRAAKEKAPELEFRQTQRTMSRILESDKQIIRIPVEAGQITLSIRNPYAVEIADRNLILQQLKFTPKSENY